MNTMITLAFAVTNSLGQMSLIAVLYGAVLRSGMTPRLRSAALGLLFGSGAVLAMWTPALSPDGFIVDARAIIVGLAGAFAGLPALVAATVMACVFRIWLGGLAAPLAVVGILIAAAAGAIWRHHWPVGQVVGFKGLGLLGVAIACNAVSILFVPIDVGHDFLALLAGSIFAASLISTLVLGSMMQREAAQIERERSLSDFAYGDPLTGLANRRAFERRLAAAEFADGGKTFSLSIIDVDRFKSVNDTYGHGAGDMVLRRIADVLKSMIRERDLVARFGGEEFVVLMPETTQEEAREISERIRRRMASERIVILGDTVQVTISIGVASAAEREGRRDIVAVADEALYLAKESGRNCTIVGARANVVPLERNAPRTGRRTLRDAYEASEASATRAR